MLTKLFLRNVGSPLRALLHVRRPEGGREGDHLWWWDDANYGHDGGGGDDVKKKDEETKATLRTTLHLVSLMVMMVVITRMMMPKRKTRKKWWWCTKWFHRPPWSPLDCAWRPSGCHRCYSRLVIVNQTTMRMLVAVKIMMMRASNIIVVILPILI